MLLEIASAKLDQQTSQDDDDPDLEKYDTDYHTQLEHAGDKAIWLTSNGSFYDCGLYQFASFIFISITWTIGEYHSPISQALLLLTNLTSLFLTLSQRLVCLRECFHRLHTGIQMRYRIDDEHKRQR
jgi:hypothetical protein